MLVYTEWTHFIISHPGFIIIFLHACNAPREPEKGVVFFSDRLRLIISSIYNFCFAPWLSKGTFGFICLKLCCMETFCLMATRGCVHSTAYYIGSNDKTTMPELMFLRFDLFNLFSCYKLALHVFCQLGQFTADIWKRCHVFPARMHILGAPKRCNYGYSFEILDGCLIFILYNLRLF